MTMNSSDHTKNIQTNTKSEPDPFSALAQITAETFDPLLSSKFSVDLSTAIVSPSLEHLLEQTNLSRQVILELVEVTRYPGIKSRIGENGREPFSLLFRGSHQQPLISAIYTVSHPDLTALNLFLNPIQITLETKPENHPEGLFYEFCFT